MSDETRLTVHELTSLRRESPERLFAHLMEVRQGFLFGVEDHREQAERWGGEFRVSINRNLALHFARGFSPEMPDEASLPQFVVMPDEARAGTTQDSSTTVDGDTFSGVIYYLDPDDYEVYVEELSLIVAEYPEFDLVPDTYCIDREVLGYLRDVVLKHPTVVAEREFDFRQGIVGGTSAPPLPEVAREDHDADEEGKIDPDYDVIEGEHLRTLRFRTD